VEQLFKRLLEEPTMENFISVRDGLAASELYDPYSNDFHLMKTKILEGDFAGSLQVFTGSLPNLLLSPGAYICLSIAAGELGHKEKSEWAKAVAHFLMSALLNTGDGSEGKPFVVLRVEDEYDLLMALKKKCGAQFLLFNSKSQRVLDRFICTDESEVYFDITLPYKRLNELGARKKDNARSR
jgi:Domain of unknown function (DUF4919)